MSKADLESLVGDAGGLIGGVRGAIEYGASLSEAEGSCLYLAHDAFDRLASKVAFVADPLGSIRLRIVDRAAWQVIPAGEFAPRAAVALDLLDSADPRHWIAAEQLIADG